MADDLASENGLAAGWPVVAEDLALEGAIAAGRPDRRLEPPAARVHSGSPLLAEAPEGGWQRSGSFSLAAHSGNRARRPIISSPLQNKK